MDSSGEDQSFRHLREVIRRLRAPDGCPWDRVQTHASLRPYMIEEAYEAAAALDGHPSRLAEELGDVLLQVLLHTQIAEEAGDFTISDVMNGLAEKLERRHPHVFGDASAETPSAVMAQWDELKREERGGDSALHGIPLALPALARAQTVQRRVSSAGFAWESIQQAWEALDEELAELRDANTPEKQADELGDALFALASLGSWLNADAEEALSRATDAFIRRYERLERLASERAVDLRGASLEAKLTLWEDAREE